MSNVRLRIEGPDADVTWSDLGLPSGTLPRLQPLAPTPADARHRVSPARGKLNPDDRGGAVRPTVGGVDPHPSPAVGDEHGGTVDPGVGQVA